MSEQDLHPPIDDTGLVRNRALEPSFLPLRVRVYDYDTATVIVICAYGRGMMLSAQINRAAFAGDTALLDLAKRNFEKALADRMGAQAERIQDEW